MKQSASARQSSRRRSLLWSSSRNSRHWFNPSKGWNSTTVWYGPLVIEFSGEKYPPLVGKSSTISLWYWQQSSGDLLAFTPRFNRLGENVDQPSRSKTFKITSPLSRQFSERYSSPIVDGQHFYSSQMERVRLPSFTLLDPVAHPGSKEICENCQKTNNKVSGGPSIGKKKLKNKKNFDQAKITRESQSAKPFGSIFSTNRKTEKDEIELWRTLNAFLFRRKGESLSRYVFCSFL